MDDYKNNLSKNANPKLYEYAKSMRKDPTKAEEILWQNLRNRKLGGLKFRRQHPLDKFIPDFYCHEKKLVVEIDGSFHDSMHQRESDDGRTYDLNELGIKLNRFSNDEVLQNLKKVLATIIETANQLT